MKSKDAKVEGLAISKTVSVAGDTAGAKGNGEAPKDSRPRLKDISLVYEDRICVRTPRDQKDCDVRGLEVFPDGRIVVADRANRKIKLFDHDGKFLSSYQISGELFFHDNFVITLTSEGEIILMRSLLTKKDLCVLGVEQNKIMLKERFELDDDYGLILAVDDKIIAIPVIGNKVCLLDREGITLWKKPLDQIETGARARLFRISSCTCFLEGDKHVVLLCELYGERIIKLDAHTGDVIKMCSDKTLVSYSYGIAVDKCGFVYVWFGLSGEIRALSPDLTEQKTVLPRTAVLSPKLIKYDASDNSMLISQAGGGQNANFIQRFNVVGNK